MTTDVADEGRAEDTSELAAKLVHATRPEEGLEAFDRLLHAGSLENVVVLPQDLDKWIEAETASASSSARSAAAAIDPELLAELMETEKILAEHDAVAEAAVTAHFDRPGRTRLLAHVVWDADQHATVSELRRFLRGRLPDDRLPQNFVELEGLPRADDGGVRRDSLDDPYGIADDHVEPRSDTERAIAKIWCETLRIDRVGVYDNFFDIGGHSLLAMRAILKTEKKVGVRLNNAIMVLQTLEQIAAECDKRLPAAKTGTPDDRDAGVIEQPTSGLASRLMRAVRGKGAGSGESR